MPRVNSILLRRQASLQLIDIAVARACVPFKAYFSVRMRISDYKYTLPTRLSLRITRPIPSKLTMSPTTSDIDYDQDNEAVSLSHVST